MRISKKNRERIKISSLSAAAVLLLCAIIGIVIAYYTNNDKAANDFTVGENENSIVEEFDPPDSQTVGPNKYQKEVSVQNTGAVECYVRLYVDFSDSEILSYSALSDDNVVSAADALNFYAADPTAEGSFAKYVNSSSYTGKWKYVADDTDLSGYYYYTEPVPPGGVTEPLFRWINTTYAEDDAANIRQYEVLVYSETVQTLNSSGESYTGEDPWKQAWTDFLAPVAADP